MKPFDLKAAKAGAKLCTRNGDDARIICFNKQGRRPIVALVNISNEERTVEYTNNGRRNDYTIDNTNWELSSDLMLKEQTPKQQY